jgi:MFS family permease
LWLPHLVTVTIGASTLIVGAVTAIPYLFAIAALWLNARYADRTGRYCRHVMIPLALGAAALVLSVALGQYRALSIVLVSLAMAGALAYDGPFWASSSRAVPVALAGGAMGLINALGNLGGFAGPYFGGYLQDVSGGSFLSAAVVLSVALLAGGLVMLTLRRHADQPVRPQPARQPAVPAGRAQARARPGHGM